MAGSRNQTHFTHTNTQTHIHTRTHARTHTDAGHADKVGHVVAVKHLQHGAADQAALRVAHQVVLAETIRLRGVLDVGNNARNLLVHRLRSRVEKREGTGSEKGGEIRVARTSDINDTNLGAVRVAVEEVDRVHVLAGVRLLKPLLEIVKVVDVAVVAW